MQIEFIHTLVGFLFFAIWAMIGQLSVATRPARSSLRSPNQELD